MKTAFLFPGQGAQHGGMGQCIYDSSQAAREVFQRCEAATGINLRQLCFRDTGDEINRTDRCQIAIFAVSAATLEAMKELQGDKMPKANVMAGLSLGEYTALYAAGAMDLETAAKLVAYRGELMQRAAAAVPSGMVSVLGLDETKANELCQAASDGEVLTCANFNCPGQIVLSGQADACKRVEQMAKDFGASGAVPLKVAGAFHSEIMAPAAEKLREALYGIKSALAEPSVPVVANVDAQPYRGAKDIEEKLICQLTSPVRWQQSMEYLLAQGVEKFYEIGPGRVLAGLMRRIQRKVDFHQLEFPQGDRETLRELTGGI